MEDTLRDFVVFSNTCGGRVLILVLMEDTLREYIEFEGDANKTVS